ncbi:3-methyl-2-oxobutanoate hydroxymethyltransferase [Savagea sp. SN6]|uniref:3-methyl-2-oxobutanoate hydroxymethyltransferase n=1 Tax=Savagea serpentis TaxID=2785297 RepID=A0A8J7KE45_9BACL|nr:3-methyl-2-oxobutanoate hydroxymethyltransferase [Savagea serpentis]MBF4500816.1 3-methyl-2-oxobutanoate hydroxymethyltransferase [Savagea serpentis]
MKGLTNFRKMKDNGEKIVMLTAYDYPTAQFAERADVDLLLVGDSVGMVALGYESTASVTVDEMIHHAKAVRRGARDTFVVVDMPFGSYHISQEETMKTAIRMYQETNADALKVEGAGEVIDSIERLTTAGIPIVAHLGLLPQSAAVQGGYRVQGKTASQARQLIEDAQAVERAGACMLVLELIPHQLAKEVSEAVSIPVIGIGAGKDTDGQVLVIHDIVQFGLHRLPKFVKVYGDIGTQVEKAMKQYVADVRQQTFPSEAHHFTMEEDELQQLYGGVLS